MLTKADVEHVAALARLGLQDGEIERMREQLSSILGHIEAIDRLDTATIPPTAQVIAMTNVWREDVVTPSLPRDAVLANAPRQIDRMFAVQAVLAARDRDERASHTAPAAAATGHVRNRAVAGCGVPTARVRHRDTTRPARSDLQSPGPA